MNGFDCLREPGELEIALAPKLRHIDRAADETERFLRDHAVRIPPFHVLLVLREALTNAVLYGSRHEEHSRIVYRLRLDGGRLTMEVEDDGDGFDWRAGSDEVPEAEAECGRGRAILTLYASGYRYNETGNRLAVFWTCE